MVIPPDWRVDERPVDYDDAISFMEDKVGLIRNKGDNDLVWLLQHPPLYTAGTSAQVRDLVAPVFPVYETGRGGQYTYHGPGQRVAYVMMDLQRRGADLRQYVRDLEEWLIAVLQTLDVKGERRKGRIGIWVSGNGSEEKIAAVGIRVRKWVTYHGVSINLDPDITHYNGIIPCGIREYGVTSLKKLGVNITMAELDQALQQSWEPVFGGLS
ncbi:MAG: lipoyl(octanoyl) transferase LipB [Proteobacteria bacterium]|nr:lipoyl(octanoyl) transferase LipB [Pseudomonadota bacterium]